MPLVTYGKSRRQAEAIIGDAVASGVEYARATGKPIVIEMLDFRQKKPALEGQSRKYRRMLSSFSYGKIRAHFLSWGCREGVEVHQANPAFSSVIGRVKFMERYGLTEHQPASLVLARWLLGCSERIPRRWVCPVGNGAHVAFVVLVRKRVQLSPFAPQGRTKERAAGGCVAAYVLLSSNPYAPDTKKPAFCHRVSAGLSPYRRRHGPACFHHSRRRSTGVIRDMHSPRPRTSAE